MSAWLENIYTGLTRLFDFLNMGFEAISSGVAYVSASVSALFSAALPTEMLGVVVLAVGVCIVLLILGR